MSVLRRSLWFALVILSLAVLLHTQGQRWRAGQMLGHLTGGNLREAVASDQSVTGWADGGRRWMPANPLGSGREWVREAQTRRAKGEVAGVDYDTVPETRPSGISNLALGSFMALGRLEEALSGRPAGVALESAAVYYEGAWRILGWLVATLLGFAWSRERGAALLGWGWVAAPVLAGAFAANSFHPLVPVAFLLLGQVGMVMLASRATRWRATVLSGLAGLFGALAFAWAAEVATLLVAGMMAAFVLTGRSSQEWSRVARVWSMAGVFGLIALSFGEPHSWTWPADVARLHGSHAGLWLGLALLRECWSRDFGRKWGRVLVAGAGLVLLTPWALAWAGPATEFLWTRDPNWARLPGVDRAEWGTLAQALVQGGGVIYGLLLVETLLAVVLVFLAWRGPERPASRWLAVFVLGLVVLSWIQLRFWFLAEVALLWLAAERLSAFGQAKSRLRTWSGAVMGLLLTLAGLALAWPVRVSSAKTSLSVAEAEGLLLRDLGHWLRHRHGGSVNLWAPPESIEAIIFAGDHRGLGGNRWESREGVAAALRLANSTSPDEALELVRSRALDYLVLPTWDRSLEALVLRSRNLDTMPPALFLAVLPRFEQPKWLRPVPYNGPSLPGLESRRVLVFQVVDEQDDVTAFSCLAEALVEMGDAATAQAVARYLETYASDLNALVARGIVMMSTGQAREFQAIMRVVSPLLEAGAEANLDWDRRVSLAIVLAQADQRGAARTILEGLMAEVEEGKLRQLTPNQLLRLLVLSRLAEVPFPDAALEEKAVGLVPEAARRHLPPKAVPRP